MYSKESGALSVRQVVVFFSGSKCSLEELLSCNCLPFLNEFSWYNLCAMHKC